MLELIQLIELIIKNNLFLSIIKKSIVISWIANKFSFEERDVENRSVIVNKLEEINF